MTYEEKGIYSDLLAISWANGPLKLDEFLLALPARKTTSFKRKLKSILASKFIEKDGRFLNPRLEEEREKQQKHRRTQSENGTKGGRPKNPPVVKTESQTKPAEKPTVSDSVSYTDTDSSAITEPNLKTKTKKTARAEFSVCFDEVWDQVLKEKLPEKFKAQEFRDAFENWSMARLDGGLPAPLDAMVIRSVCYSMANSDYTDRENLRRIHDAAAGGWKGLQEIRKNAFGGRVDPTGPKPESNLERHLRQRKKVTA